MSYTGICVSGPWNGQQLAHSTRAKPLLRPIVGQIAVVIGEYRLNDFGQWHWWETPEGRACETLFGKPE